ncbi:MAG TPA: hypothetical protein PK858_09095 [Saprospiraceae bacterium]|nr:hypothetical protein [Saprospiraceae bacterium]
MENGLQVCSSGKDGGAITKVPLVDRPGGVAALEPHFYFVALDVVAEAEKTVIGTAIISALPCLSKGDSLCMEEEKGSQKQAGNEGTEVSWRCGGAVKLKVLFINWSELKSVRGIHRNGCAHKRCDSQM